MDDHPNIQESSKFIFYKILWKYAHELKDPPPPTLKAAFLEWKLLLILYLYLDTINTHITDPITPTRAAQVRIQKIKCYVRTFI
jgi:hypothetical protein